MMLFFSPAFAAAPCTLPEPPFGPLQRWREGDAAAVADLDGDGDPDVVVEDVAIGGGHLWWFENRGGGVVGPGVPFAAPYGVGVVAVGDLDGDGDPDVLAT